DPRPLSALHSFPTRRSSDLEGADADSREIESYFIPCSETVLLTFSSPQVPTEYTDPQPSTPAGIILVLLLRKPGQSLLSASDFIDRKSTRLNSSHVKISYAV